MYKWVHPVATLPSDRGDYTSLSQNDLNSANQIARSVRLPLASEWSHVCISQLIGRLPALYCKLELWHSIV
eukprot:6186771-Pleurochrysis_carterae.AAC.1